MKRILIVLDKPTYDEINEVKKFNRHTWEECLIAYADAYKSEIAYKSNIKGEDK